jgi:periplasmic divalent cation tolerance protein
VTVDAVVVLCTAPAAAGRDGSLGAHGLAQAVVAERLCACVNVLPAVRSYYRWQGRVDAADELLLVAKTTRERAAQLRARLVALHPYEVPEVLELAVADGLPAYLGWLAEAVAPEAAP